MTGCLDQFHLRKKIGSGYASSVYLATCKTTGNQVAVKLYHKSKLSELNYFQVAREIKIHSSLGHQNILELWAAFEDQYGIYLISEFAGRGDVFSDVEKRGGRLTEPEAAQQVVHPFLQALIYLHNLNIIHRDIKPENLLFTSTGVLKVADFGLSINFVEEHPVTRVGTLDYMAPEVVTCPDKHKPHEHKDKKHLHYTPVVDAWAVGVLLYELITGHPPFDKGHKKLTVTEIVRGEPIIPSSVSDMAASFICWALTKDKHKRPTVAQLIEHPWIMQNVQIAPRRPNLARMRLLHHSSTSKELRFEAGISQNGPAEVVEGERVSELHQERVLGMVGSKSMNAASMMRWRDIAFNANAEESYDFPEDFATKTPLRRSLGGDSHAGSRRNSLAAGLAGRAPTAAETAIALARAGLGSGMASPCGTMSPQDPRMLSREELTASLRASASKLSKSVSFRQAGAASALEPQPLGGGSKSSIPRSRSFKAASPLSAAGAAGGAKPFTSGYGSPLQSASHANGLGDVRIAAGRAGTDAPQYWEKEEIGRFASSSLTLQAPQSPGPRVQFATESFPKRLGSPAGTPRASALRSTSSRGLRPPPSFDVGAVSDANISPKPSKLDDSSSLCSPLDNKGMTTCPSDSTGLAGQESKSERMPPGDKGFLKSAKGMLGRIKVFS